MDALFSILSWIFSNLLTLGIVGAIIYFIFISRRKASVDKLSQPPAPTGTKGETVDEYTGTTGGINWKLRSTVLKKLPGRNRDWLRSTRWETSTVKFPPGKYLMVMSIAGGEIPKGNFKQEGLLNTIINQAADFALDIYVGGYFGAQYQPMINVTGDSVKIDKPELSDFFILSNHEPVAQAFLDEATTTVLSQWKKQKMGFTRENNVDQFGILFCEDGVIFSCKSDMANEQEATMLADFAAVLCVKMRGIVG